MIRYQEDIDTQCILGLVALLGISLVQGEQLIWEDNFDFLDTNKWEHKVSARGGGNGEFQVYVPDRRNSYTRNGVLFLEPTLLKDNINPRTGRPFGEQFLRTGVMNLRDMYGKCSIDLKWACFRDKGNVPPIASSCLRTRGKFAFKYGRVEVRAKMPGGDWHWPAIWLLPERYVYGRWPASGEIDIVEIIGNRDFKDRNGRSEGQDKASSNLHWGINDLQNKHNKTRGYRYDKDVTFADDFHIYSCEWSPNGFTFAIDGQSFLKVPNPHINRNPWWRGFYEFGKPWRGSNNPWRGRGNMAPFDQEFYLLLNVAVGGTNGYFADGYINHGGRFPKPWRNSMSWRQAKDSFYNKRNDWLWTWQRPNHAMQDTLTVLELESLIDINMTEWTNGPNHNCMCGISEASDDV